MERVNRCKAKFEKYELQAFDVFYSNLIERNASEDLILYIDSKPYSFRVIALEIMYRTVLGRKFLDRIEEMRLI